jgi:hypothetical protein
MASAAAGEQRPGAEGDRAAPVLRRKFRRLVPMRRAVVVLMRPMAILLPGGCAPRQRAASRVPAAPAGA